MIFDRRKNLMKIQVVCWGEHEMKGEIYNVDSVHLEPWPETVRDEHIDPVIKASRHVTDLSLSDNGFLRIACHDSMFWKNQRLIVHIVSDQAIEIETDREDYAPPEP
jgi:hypothetical protein